MSPDCPAAMEKNETINLLLLHFSIKFNRRYTRVGPWALLFRLSMLSKRTPADNLGLKQENEILLSNFQQNLSMELVILSGNMKYLCFFYTLAKTLT